MFVAAAAAPASVCRMYPSDWEAGLECLLFHLFLLGQDVNYAQNLLLSSLAPAAEIHLYLPQSLLLGTRPD